MRIEDMQVGEHYWLDCASEPKYHGREVEVTSVTHRSFPIRAVLVEVLEDDPPEIILLPTEVSQFPIKESKFQPETPIEDAQPDRSESIIDYKNGDVVHFYDTSYVRINSEWFAVELDLPALNDGMVEHALKNTLDPAQNRINRGSE